jgi:hypothetical protein
MILKMTLTILMKMEISNGEEDKPDGFENEADTVNESSIKDGREVTRYGWDTGTYLTDTDDGHALPYNEDVMGGRTTIAVADRLNRKWIGIDQSVQAVKVTELRLGKQQDLFSAPFSVQLQKYDYDTLRYKNAFEFESWIVQQFGGTSNAKQRNDFGLDGKMPDNTPIQVKRSDNIGRNVIDNFKSAVERYDKKLFSKNIENKKPIGYIIAFSFGKGAVEEVARLKLKENIIIRLVTVEEIVPIAKKPTIKVEITSPHAPSKFTSPPNMERGVCGKSNLLQADRARRV